MADTPRVTVGLDADARANLDWLREQTGLSTTGLVNRALRMLTMYVGTEIGGGELLRRTPGRDELEIVRFM